MKVPKKVKATDLADPDFFTAGYEYLIQKFVSSTSFYIYDDDGELTYCLFKNCDFLNGQDWIVTEWQEIN